MRECCRKCKLHMVMIRFECVLRFKLLTARKKYSHACIRNYGEKDVSFCFDVNLIVYTVTFHVVFYIGICFKHISFYLVIENRCQ